jgi:hypothetical protein
MLHGTWHHEVLYKHTEVSKDHSASILKVTDGHRSFNKTSINVHQILRQHIAGTAFYFCFHPAYVEQKTNIFLWSVQIMELFITSLSPLLGILNISLSVFFSKHTPGPQFLSFTESRGPHAVSSSSDRLVWRFLPFFPVPRSEWWDSTLIRPRPHPHTSYAFMNPPSISRFTILATKPARYVITTCCPFKGGYTLVTLTCIVTPYRDSVDGTRYRVTYQKLVTP